MTPRRPALAFLSALALTAWPAAAPGSIASPVTIAVPERATAVSLGVFDANGKLVRTLARHAPLSDFEIHLNGIGVKWDGLGDDGRSLTPGTYSISGYALPDTLNTEGEAVHFNSLVTADGHPAAGGIVALASLSPPLIVTTGPDSPQESLWTLDAEDTPIEPVVLAPDERFADAGPDNLLIRKESQWIIRSRTASSPELAVESPDGPAAIGAAEWALVDNAAGRLVVRSTSDGSLRREVSLTGPVSMVAAAGDGFLLSDGLSVWMENQGKPAQLPLPDLTTILSLAPGPAGTIWVAGKTTAAEGAGKVLIRQYSPAGDVLRQIALPDDTRTVVLRGDPGTLHLGYVLTDSKGTSAIALTAPPETPALPESTDENQPRQAEWAIVFDHRIELTRNPGFLDGRTTATDAPASQPVSYTLPASELGPSSTLVLSVTLIDGHLWMTSGNGLPLLELPPQTTDSPAAWDKIDANRLAVLIPVPGAVAEFTIRGIRGIVPISAGEITLEP